MKLIWIIVLIFACGAVGTSQTKDSKNGGGVKQLDFLVGKWQGQGWSEENGQRKEFFSTENVQYKLGETALLIEGTHTDKFSPKMEKPSVFEALALVTFNPKADNFLWRTATKEKGGGNFEAKLLGEKSLEWGLKNVFRFTIEINKSGQWFEIGEISKDGGKTWVKNFEMTLNRVE